MREIVVLGSTGSIGQNTLAVARHLGSEKIKVKGLAVRSNIALLEEQIHDFHPSAVAVGDVTLAREVEKRYPYLSVFAGLEGIKALASLPGHPLVVSAMSGTFGLEPTLSAICAGNDVALANKEVLVSGGAYVTSLAHRYGVKLLPVDSEHSALFQCLQGVVLQNVRRIILTASGGPFRTYTDEQLSNITVEQALQHPSWKMGPKITIDSSTLMNKGLEVIEAHWLFGISPSAIEVVVHPQSIIHSMIECSDSSILAQMGLPDMKLPIQYALTYPERMASPVRPFDFTTFHLLEFFPVDFSRFRCLKLAYQAVHSGGSFSCFMNAANEVLVERFLQKQISWQRIATGLEELMEKHHSTPLTSLEDILATDREARAFANEILA